MKKRKPLANQVTVVLLFQIYLRVALFYTPVICPVYESISFKSLHILVWTARVSIERSSLNVR